MKNTILLTAFSDDGIVIQEEERDITVEKTENPYKVHHEKQEKYLRAFLKELVQKNDMFQTRETVSFQVLTKCWVSFSDSRMQIKLRRFNVYSHGYKIKGFTLSYIISETTDGTDTLFEIVLLKNASHMLVIPDTVACTQTPEYFIQYGLIEQTQNQMGNLTNITFPKSMETNYTFWEYFFEAENLSNLMTVVFPEKQGLFVNNRFVWKKFVSEEHKPERKTFLQYLNITCSEDRSFDSLLLNDFSSYPSDFLILLLYFFAASAEDEQLRPLTNADTYVSDILPFLYKKTLSESRIEEYKHYFKSQVSSIAVIKACLQSENMTLCKIAACLLLFAPKSIQKQTCPYFYAYLESEFDNLYKNLIAKSTEEKTGTVLADLTAAVAKNCPSLLKDNYREYLELLNKNRQYEAQLYLSSITPEKQNLTLL